MCTTGSLRSQKGAGLTRHRTLGQGGAERERHVLQLILLSVTCSRIVSAGDM